MKSCAFVLLFSFSYVYSEDDNRGDLSNGDTDFPISKLPVDVQSDLIKILKRIIDPTWGICSGTTEPDYNKVEFLLYTNDTEISTKLDPTNPVGIDYNAPLFLLSHGWCSGLNGTQIKAFRDKYIEVYRKNIIFVYWGELAWLPYPTAYCKIPFVAQHVANFLCELSVKNNYELTNVHMIGHSLGGQLSGLTGKATQKICNKKMGRITGLDPAGPIYQIVSADKRLAPTDAEFVEIVHSNSGLFGYMGKCGSVDYHLNSGSRQPGCAIYDAANISEYSFFEIFCSHVRALEVWPYVLESDQFKGKSCKLISVLLPFCNEDTNGADFISMGQTNTTPKNEHYSVLTGENPPYYLGCKPYPSQGCE